jgi:hypothetical protein
MIYFYVVFYIIILTVIIYLFIYLILYLTELSIWQGYPSVLVFAFKKVLLKCKM